MLDYDWTDDCMCEVVVMKPIINYFICRSRGKPERISSGVRSCFS